MPRIMDYKELAFRIRRDPVEQQSGFVVNKFGMNLVIAAGDDVWDGSAAYTGWLTAAAALEVVSASTADDVGQNGAHSITVQGIDGATRGLKSVTVSMDGQAAVDLPGTWYRVFRAWVVSSGSGQVNAGNITIRLDDAGATVAIITAEYGQTEMAIYTIAAGYTGYLFNVHCEVKGESAANVTATFHISTNDNGAGWRVRHVFDIMNGFDNHEWLGGLELPAGTDIRIRTTAISKEAPGSAEFDLICLK